MAVIPSKQRIRAGELEILQEKLIDREIGFCTTDRLLYIKYDGVLIPAGDGAIPVPTNTSLFMGGEDGGSGWVDLGKVESPYVEDTYVWVSLDGVKFAAEFAYKDSFGRPISSNSYVIPSVLNVYGPITIENDASSHFLKVSVGDSDMIGGLVPAEPPSASAGSEDPAFSEGDLLVAHSFDGGVGPSLSWVHPDAVPVENSKMPTTSGAVYTIRKFIDPNLYTPNTGSDFVIGASDGETLSTTYEEGKYYIFGDRLYRCTSFSSVKAEFSDVEGLVTALNDTLDIIGGGGVIYVEQGVTYADVMAVVGAGKLPVIRVGSGQGYNYYYPSWTGSGLQFICVTKFGDILYREMASSGGSWTSGDASPIFIATYGQTTLPELDDAFKAGKVLLLVHVPIGTDQYIDMTMSERLLITGGGVRYTFASPIRGNSYFSASIQTNGSWDIANNPL